MKKVNLSLVLFCFCFSLHAVDFSSNLQLKGTLFNYDNETKSVGLFKIKNQNSMDLISLNLSLTSENAGGSFILPELTKIADNSTEWNVWFKPLDSLKISAGTVYNSLNKETNDEDELSLINYNDFGYSLTFTYNKFNLSVALTPGNDQYWFYSDYSLKTKAGEKAYKKAYDKAYQYMYDKIYVEKYAEYLSSSTDTQVTVSTGNTNIGLNGQLHDGTQYYYYTYTLDNNGNHTHTVSINEIIEKINKQDAQASEKIQLEARKYAEKEAEAAKAKAITETKITAFSGLNVFMSLKTSLGTFCAIMNAESDFNNISVGAGFRKQFGGIAIFTDVAYYIVNKKLVKYSFDFDIIYVFDSINAQLYAVYSSGNEIGAIGKFSYNIGSSWIYLYLKDMDILNKDIQFSVKPGMKTSFGMLNFDFAVDFYFQKERFNISVPVSVGLQFN